MDSKKYNKKIESLRSADRLKLLELETVVETSLKKIFVTKMLDIGTGSGIFAEAYELRNIQVTGIDSNPEMISTASSLVPKAHFQKADAEALPFNNGAFDLVFMGLVLHECNNPELVLKEARRVARVRAAVLEWPYVESDTGPSMVYRLKSDQIKKMAHRAGFKVFTTIKLTSMNLYLLQ